MRFDRKEHWRKFCRGHYILEAPVRRVTSKVGHRADLYLVREVLLGYPVTKLLIVDCYQGILAEVSLKSRLKCS